VDRTTPTCPSTVSIPSWPAKTATRMHRSSSVFVKVILDQAVVGDQAVTAPLCAVWARALPQVAPKRIAHALPVSSLFS
jgi:hypothetical protein